jgi:hypothetical protein
LALFILVVVYQHFGGWHSVFWWLCSNSLEVGTLYFGSCVPRVWRLALFILVVVFQQFGGTSTFRAFL